MNDYYNRLFDVLPQTFARSGAVEAEFLRIEQGFDAVQPHLQELTAARQGQASLLANMLLKAPLASPAFTGVPTVPTAPNGTSSEQAASTAFTQAAIAAAVAVPGALVDVDVTTTPFNIQNGQRALIKGAMAITINAPAYSDSGRWAFKVCNGRTDNLIAWGGANHQGISDATMTLDSPHAAAEVIGVDATYGWGLV